MYTPNHHERDERSTTSCWDHALKVEGGVPPGVGTTLRLGTVESVKPTGKNAAIVLIGTQAGTISLAVAGDVEKLLSKGAKVFLNPGSIVPKVDDFSKRPDSNACYQPRTPRAWM
jgi:hypothetical protein